MPNSSINNRSLKDKIVFIIVVIWLASLTVKYYQEVFGVRVISSFLPFLLLVFNYKKIASITIPFILMLYILFIMICVPFFSFMATGDFSFYLIYIDVTVFSAVLVMYGVLVILKKDLLWLAQVYAQVIIVMCGLSYFTLENQWFGGSSIRSFSDFATFFALQASVAVPFVSGKWKFIKQLFIATTIFFTFSRVSFVLSFFAIIIQNWHGSASRKILILSLLICVIASMLIATDLGITMMAKMQNFFLVIFSPSLDVGEVNPSDLGRLAYADTTLNSFKNFYDYLFGHGIKTNAHIIEDQLNTRFWGLDDSMQQGTVHNVYLEIFSDLGLFGIAIFASFMAHIGISLVYKYGFKSPFFISFSIFFVTYLFEANYVSFFFQFFMIFYLLACTTQFSAKKMENRLV